MFPVRCRTDISVSSSYPLSYSGSPEIRYNQKKFLVRYLISDSCQNILQLTTDN
ncbi:Uncharacterized protein dnm_052890 [Desulfonema magnum]|uniref:Uncharacterized protein n=1 Tax=Desulfonema magnum TaxID=45655 RepID=A0A975BP17_9BACT|nr:Uncharacterized protein dnm_052890 [Desulfonema magnum]